MLLPAAGMSVATASQRKPSTDLSAAFAAFGSASNKLSDAFEALQNRVSALTGELAEARAGSDRLATRLAAVIDGLPGGVVVLDAQGRIAEANSAARALLDDLAVGEVFDEGFVRRLARPIAARGDIELSSGRFINLSRRALSSGEVVLITDVSEAHLMQIVLSRQQRLLTLGELAAGLAHQIRTPLAAALLYASQMTLPNRDPVDLVRCAHKTTERLKELDTLVNEMLAFARGGTLRESVSVSAVLEQVAQWLRPALRAGVSLTIRTEAPDLRILANAPALVSALLNLATNALQSSAGALAVKLLARRSKSGRAEIIVSDDGPGVPVHLQDQIFEPFFTTRARGTGLGLAIVRSVIEAHQGSVRLAAENPRGASFVIDLPEEIA
jgi:two-component system, sensor histidine kinase FlrB